MWADQLGNIKVLGSQVAHMHLQRIDTYREKEEEEFVWEMVDEDEQVQSILIKFGQLL